MAAVTDEAAAHSAATPPRKVDRRLLRLVQGLVSVIILGYLWSLLDISTITARLSAVSLAAYWPAPLLSLLGLTFAAQRWVLLLRPAGIRLSRGRAYRLYLAATFYNVLLPGAIGGDAVRSGLLAAAQRGRAGTVIGSVLLERVLGLYGLALIGTMAAVVVPQPAPGAVALGLQWIAALLLAGLTVAAAVVGLLAGRIPAPDGQRGPVAVALATINDLRRLPVNVLLHAIGLSMVYQLTDIAVTIYLARLLAIDVAPQVFFAVIPIVSLVTLLPVSLGGIGVREGILTLLLGAYGVAPPLTVLLALLIAMNRIAVALCGGIVQWLPQRAAHDSGDA